MTKDELLAIYNSPAYRSAKYNYVWKDDGNAITNFWSDYENRRQRDLQNELNQAYAELEKKAIKEEQDEANKQQLLENYMTAQTKVANAQVLYDSAVKQSGANSADALTAKNNLDEAIWFKNNIAKKLGYEPVINYRSVISNQDNQGVPVTADEPVIPKQEKSVDDIANDASDLKNEFTKLVSPTKDELNGLLKKISALEKEANISQDTKDSLATLTKDIQAKIGELVKKDEADAARIVKERKQDADIAAALKDWKDPDNWKLLQAAGFTKLFVTGGKTQLKYPKKYKHLEKK